MSTPTLEDFTRQVSSAPRPSLLSQQSNSLPSTPYVHARKLSDESRIPPSSGKRVEITSPRSARSESDTAIRSPGRTPFLARCKYETGMAFSRRRIPYSLGGDKLESIGGVLKQALNVEEEQTLSGDIQELYSQILPSVESEDRRMTFVKKLEHILNKEWPGNSIKVHVFGSSENMLCTNDSDVDICITTSMKALERVCLLAKALDDHGMERVVCVPHAKVPIVKIWDPELQLACDMNVNNTLALENTRMIKTYVQIDSRVRPLAMVIKHWTRRRILNDAALGGTLSSYTWICMIINFLQTRTPAVLPCLHNRPHQRRIRPDGKVSFFADDVESLRDFGKPNKETLGQLLFHFFRWYAHELDYEKYVISVREGKLISKQSKKWHLMQNNRLCAEEPFNTERNLGNTVDDISFRGVHLELRRAFDLLSRAQLETCCEPYIFPPLEEKFWAKPVPQPRPVLSRSHSQSGRPTRGGGIGSRGGQNATRHRSNTSNRRASSATASNKTNLYPQGRTNSQAAPNDRSAGREMHEQLLQHYQLLQAQEQQLRMQMHQRAQAGIHAHATAPLQPLQVQNLSSFTNAAASDSTRRKLSIDPVPLSAPPRNVVMQYSARPGQATSVPLQPGAQTNPSSPSMATAQPALRRPLHRATTTDDGYGTVRSHSQPAAKGRLPVQSSGPLPMSPFFPYIQGSPMGFGSLQQYQQAYYQSQQLWEQRKIALPIARGPSMSPNSQINSGYAENPLDGAVLAHKEYVGYYVDRSLPDHRAPSTFIHPIPSYYELAHHLRGMSPNLTRLRSHTSRSPSPSHPSTRERSISFYSAPPIVQTSPAPGKEHAASVQTRSSGPIIVDGNEASEYVTASEPGMYPHATSEAASLSDDPPIYTPGTPSAATPLHDPSDSFALDSTSENSQLSSMPNVLKFGDFPVRGTFKPGSARRGDDMPAFDTYPQPVETVSNGGRSEGSNALGIDFAGPIQVPAGATSPAYRISPPIGTSPRSTQPKPDSINVNSLPEPLSSLKPLPLLSPVRELRTPSPMAPRGIDLRDSSSRKAHARSVSLLPAPELLSASPTAFTNGNNKTESPPLAKVNGQINGITSHTESDKATGSSVNLKSPQVQVSGWKEAGKKGKKGRGKNNSVSSLALGEATSSNGERKGG